MSPAALEADHFVRRVRDLARVGHQDHALALVVRQLAEHLDDAVGGVLVEAAGGLVGEEDVDLAGEGAGDDVCSPKSVRRRTARTAAVAHCVTGEGLVLEGTVRIAARAGRPDTPTRILGFGTTVDTELKFAERLEELDTRRGAVTECTPGNADWIRKTLKHHA